MHFILLISSDIITFWRNLLCRIFSISLAFWKALLRLPSFFRIFDLLQQNDEKIFSLTLSKVVLFAFIFYPVRAKQCIIRYCVVRRLLVIRKYEKVYDSFLLWRQIVHDGKNYVSELSMTTNYTTAICPFRQIICGELFDGKFAYLSEAWIFACGSSYNFVKPIINQ